MFKRNVQKREGNLKKALGPQLKYEDIGWRSDFQESVLKFCVE